MERKLSLLGFAVMFLIGSDTFVVAPLLPSLAKAFDVSTTQSGWLVSVYAIGYALTGLLSGPISDRGNRRIILPLGMVVFALATAACAVSPGFWTMFAFHFITGGAAAPQEYYSWGYQSVPPSSCDARATRCPHSGHGRVHSRCNQ